MKLNKLNQLAGLLIVGLLLIGGYAQRDALASFTRDLTGTQAPRDIAATRNVTIGGTLVMSGALSFYSRTTAQLDALTPSAAAETYYNSSLGKVLVSTGTGLADFADMDGTSWY